MFIYSFQELNVAILEGTGTYSPPLLAPAVGLGGPRGSLTAKWG